MTKDIVDEIKEYQTQEAISKFLHKFGKLIIAICILIILISAIFVYWNYRNTQRQEQYSIYFTKAFESKNNAEINKVINSEAGGFSDIAKLNYAQNLGKKNNLKQAAEIYQKLFSESKFEEIRNYALYQLGGIALSSNANQLQQQFLNYANKISGNDFKDLIFYIKILILNNNNDKTTALNLIKELKEKKNINHELLTLIDVVENNLTDQPNEKK